jgi:hypothetical protein
LFALILDGDGAWWCDPGEAETLHYVLGTRGLVEEDQKKPGPDGAERRRAQRENGRERANASRFTVLDLVFKYLAPIQHGLIKAIVSDRHQQFCGQG